MTDDTPTPTTPPIDPELNDILQGLSDLASEALGRAIVFKNGLKQAVKWVDDNVPNAALYTTNYPSSPYGAHGVLDNRYIRAVIRANYGTY